MAAPARAWPAALAAAALAAWWPAAGQLALAAAGLLAAHAALRAGRREGALALAAALAWGCVLALGWHFAADRFGLRYVWLYGSAELPLHLKVASLWAGDEGTTLLLAACCASLAAAGARGGLDGRRWSVAAAIAAWYCLTASWLEPFAPTPQDWLAQSPSQGMNVHLMKVWMLFHAPLVLAAHAWALALAGPALAALRGDAPGWPAMARAWGRRAWVVLTAGIGFGMVWAFEDAMYGQLWHWDPVQTAVFCLWCFLGAHLHGIVGWGAGRRRWRVMPVAALLAAATAPLAMAVTRNPVLASSHRYVGADSWMSHLALGGLLLAGAAWCAFRRRPAAVPAPDARAASDPGRWLAQLGFLAAGAAAALQLAAAFAAGLAGMPRPEAYKPFLAMLANLTGGAELAALRAAFEQWDVDGYLLARALLVPLAGLGCAGGWYFLRRISRRLGWVSLAVAVAAAALAAVSGGVLTHGYAGAGILSQRVVAILSMLDASLVGGAYLAFGCAAWGGWLWRRAGWKGAAQPLALVAIHAGVALMLWGGLLATALNAYSQHELAFDGRAQEWVPARGGYAFRLAAIAVGAAGDGGVGSAAGVRAITTVELRGADGALADGQALYRDARAPLDRYDGPMRQVCELLDYRYARHVGTPGYVLQPLIEHGWARTVQFWIAPAAVAEAAAARDGAAVAVVVVKVFPFVSLLWSGLALTVLGGLWLAVQRPRRGAPEMAGNGR